MRTGTRRRQTFIPDSFSGLATVLPTGGVRVHTSPPPVRARNRRKTMPPMSFAAIDEASLVEAHGIISATPRPRRSELPRELRIGLALACTFCVVMGALAFGTLGWWLTNGPLEGVEAAAPALGTFSVEVR